MDAGQISSTLSLNIQNFMDNLRKAQAQVKQVTQKFTTVMGKDVRKAIKGVNSEIGGLNSGLKDTSRIVGGIILSQVFYRSVAAIQDAVMGVINFKNEMQVTTIAMEYFLGTTERTFGFIASMRDFISMTPFVASEVFAMTRRLMGMGFEAENVRYVMETMTDAASATGASTAQMDRVVLALGQIKTNGKVAGQELRQLAQAGIPVYQILREELGLTAEQLMNIGNLQIGGDVGVSAILTGLEKRYKGAAQRIAYTTTGLINTIKDDILVLSEDIFAGAYDKMYNRILAIRNFFSDAVDIVAKSGVGGLFESIFSPRTQKYLRIIIASMKSVKQSALEFVEGFKPVAAMFSGQLLKSLAEVTVAIAAIMRTLVAFAVAAMAVIPQIRWLFTAILSLLIANTVAKALILLWRVTGLGKICVAVASAVNMLTTAIAALFMVLKRNPLFLLVYVLAGALLYLALSSKTLASWLDKAFGSLSRIGDVNTDGILEPIQQAQIDTEQFNQRLADSASSFKDLGEAGKKAGKTIKDGFSAGFDELYQVPDQTDDAADSLGDMADLMDLASPDLSGLSAFEIPEPEFASVGTSGLTDTFTSMFKGIGDTFKNFFKNLPAVVATFFTDTLPSIVMKGLKSLWSWLTSWLMSDALAPFTNFFVRVGSAVWAGLQVVGLVLQSFFSGLWTAVKPAVDALWGAIVATFNVFAPLFKALIDILLAEIKIFWERHGESIKELLTSAWNAIVTIVTVIGTMLLMAITITLDAIKAFWDAWGAIIVAIVTNIFQGLVTLVSGIISGILTAVQIVFMAIQIFWAKWGETIILLITTVLQILGAIFKTALDVIMTTIKIVFEIITELWALWGNGIKTFFQGLWDIVLAIFKAALKIILEVIGVALSIINDVLKIFIALFTGDWKGLWDAVKHIFSTIWKALLYIIEVAIDLIMSLIKGFVKVFSGIFEVLWTTVATIAESSWNAIVVGIKWFVGIFTNIFAGMRDTVINIFGSIWDGIKGFINKIIDGVNAMTSAISSISIDIPEVKIPFTDKTIGGGSIGIPKIPAIRKLARGGLVDRHQLIEAGEKNHKEAMIPLDNKSYMRPFSQAVAEQLMESMGMDIPRESNTTDSRPIVYVHNLIADKTGLKQLYRELRVIEVTENQRRGMG